MGLSLLRLAIFFCRERLVRPVGDDAQKPESQKRQTRRPAGQEQQEVASITRK